MSRAHQSSQSCVVFPFFLFVVSLLLMSDLLSFSLEHCALVSTSTLHFVSPSVICGYGAGTGLAKMQTAADLKIGLLSKENLSRF